MLDRKERVYWAVIKDKDIVRGKEILEIDRAMGVSEVESDLGIEGKEFRERNESAAIQEDYTAELWD